MSRRKTLPKARGKARGTMNKSNPGLLASPVRRAAVLCLLLVVATVALYIPLAGHPFAGYDDYDYVAANSHIQAGLTLSTIAWAFTSTDFANWHPLAWLSHALDAQLFGPYAGGHHVVSVLIHALDAALLFLLFTWLTGRMGPSLLAAALFALHPFNVESVAWISERKNVLSTFFFLAAIGAYAWYAKKPDWRRYATVAALFAMGLMSKPMVITLPCVLLLLDYWPLGRIRGSEPGVLGLRQATVSRLLVEKLPLLLLSALSAVITIKAQISGYAMRPLSQFPFAVRIENAGVAYAMYLWKMLWPEGLAPLYPHPGDSLRVWQVAVSALVLVSISVLVFIWRSKRYLVTGWLWFLGTLVPVIGLVQVGDAAMADRYAYVPLIGIFVMIAWGVVDLADAKELTMAWRVVPALCVLVALTFATENQLSYWSNDYDLWAHTLAVTGPNFGANNNLGTTLIGLKRPEEAQAHFHAAAEINPRDPVSHLNIGMYLDEHGELSAAVAQLDTVIALTSDPRLLSLAYASRGAAYCELGDNVKAQESYDRALRLDPTQFNAYMGYAFFLERQGKLNEAIFNYTRAVELGHTGQGYARLGHALQLANRPTEALAAYQEALRISPELEQLLAPVINSALLAQAGRSQ